MHRPPFPTLVPGFDPATGYYVPPSGWSGYSNIGGFSGASGYSGYSGLGVANMNASVRLVSSGDGSEAFLRFLIVFKASNPSPAFVPLSPFYKSGICNWSVQPANSTSTVTAVASSLADAKDLAPDFSNADLLSWNTESLITGGNKRYFVLGPVTMLRITGTGTCHLLGA